MTTLFFVPEVQYRAGKSTSFYLYAQINEPDRKIRVVRAPTIKALLKAIAGPDIFGVDREITPSDKLPLGWLGKSPGPIRAA